MASSKTSHPTFQLVLAVVWGALLALCMFIAPSWVMAAEESNVRPSTSPPMDTGILKAPASVSEGQRAQLVAIKQAIISSELSGRIITLHFREGERFKKGDRLVSYDSALYRARLNRAIQTEMAAKKRLEVAKELRKLNSISIGDYEQTKSDVSVAKADTRIERVLVNQCQIIAPFSGRVGETFIREAEHVSEGTKLLSIYDDSAFEIEAILPSRWLAWLKPGYPMAFNVDETGAKYQAQVSRIAGIVDPVSQSVKIIGLLKKKSAGHERVPLMPGMSGTVFINPPQSPEATASK